MKATIYISGRIGKETTLVDVIRQYKSFEEPTEVLAVISSEGGNKEEGDSIYNYLDGLKSIHPVYTHAKKAYSISAKIFSVGQERTVDDTEKAVMIHFAWAKAQGGADELEEVAATLRDYENEFAAFYSVFLGVDDGTARELLDDNTFLSGQEALDLGFATKIKPVAGAVAEYSIKSNNKTMAKKEVQEKTEANFFAHMADFFNKKNKKPEINAELNLQDSAGTEIVFPDLSEGDIPSVGDKATIDGAVIPDGTYIIPSVEDSSFEFVDGVITKVIPKEIEAEIEANAGGVKKQKAEINAETEGLEISTWSMRLVNDTFAEGDTLKYIGWEGEECVVSTAEIQIPDGRTVVTDASGVIVSIKEAAGVINTDVDVEALLIKHTEKVKVDIKAEYDIKLEAIKRENDDLREKIGSKEYNAEHRGGDGEKPKQSSILLTRKKAE